MSNLQSLEQRMNRVDYQVISDDKDKRIADLEAKLAESESELEKQKEKYDKLYECYKKTSNEDLQDKYRLAEENEKLKQQLTQYEKFMKDNEWDGIEEMQETLNKCEKKYFDIQKQLAETEKELEIVCVESKDKIREYIEINLEQREEIDKLKEELAEKDKELETYKKQFNEQVWLCEEFRFQLEEKEKEIFFYRNAIKKKPETAMEMCEILSPYECELRKKEIEIEKLNAMINTLPAHDKELEEIHNQDKISFCVERLKFLKNEIEMMGHIPNYTVLPERELICRFDVFRFIDNQIEELKKEMK